VLIVVPGKTILRKTIDNFTPEHPKSVLDGMAVSPLLVTAENFNTGSMGSALHDESIFKLFVFTVQALIKPTDKVTRRTRKHQEWLGDDLYQFLQQRRDLVVIADEHHVIQEKAEAFSGAVRDLDAMAVIGLAATPAKSDLGKVVYQYPLARAIADRWVKTPVLVGRKDNATDMETRLRDGLILLEAKQKAVNEYSTAVGVTAVNAVMFIVADLIDTANEVAQVLQRPGIYPDDYEQRVLVIHSESTDDSLARLAAVEDPDSPVRVIVSVSMLKEGWDVANIYVICSFRPSISDALTEQTLGRGLRLPWGHYTGVELLDTLEVLSHERYEQLLARAGVLLEGLVETRVKSTPVIEPADVPGGTGTGDSFAVVVRDGAEPSTTAAPAPPGDLPAETPGFVITSMDERNIQAQSQTEALSQPLHPTKQLRMPLVVRTVQAPITFSLSAVPEAPFFELGEKLAAEGGTELSRKVLDVVADPTSPAGYRLVPRDAMGTVTGAMPHLPLGGALKALKDTIMALDAVNQTPRELNAADRLAQAVIDGAGSEDALASNLNAAINAARQIVIRAYRAVPPSVAMSVEEVLWGPELLNTRAVDPNRWADPFRKDKAYSGWKHSLYALVWFDSKPERVFANLLDDDSAVNLWARIIKGNLMIEWDGGRYSPDFYVDAGNRHYLVEVKADKDLETGLVRAKAKASEEWARYVTDNGGYGKSYLLVPESVLSTAKTLAAVLSQVGP